MIEDTCTLKNTNKIETKEKVNIIFTSLVFFLNLEYKFIITYLTIL